MKRYNYKKIIVLPLVIFLSLLLIGLDYANEKIIPNFFYLKQFTKSDVVSYWTAIGSIFIIIPGIINIYFIYKTYILKKQQVEYQMYQDLLERQRKSIREAITTLKENKNEYECLNAIRDLENAINIHLSEDITNISNEILPCDKIILILNDHLHTILKKESYKKRCDAQYIMKLFFNDNRIIKFCKDNDISVANFKNEYIDSSLLEGYLDFYSPNFDNINFYGNYLFSDCSLYHFSTFKNCKFHGEVMMNLIPNSNIRFINCNFLKPTKFKYDDFYVTTNKSKPVLDFNNSSFQGDISFNDLKIDTLVINNSTFNDICSISDVDFRCLDIKNSYFSNILNIQYSKFEVIYLMDIIVEKSLYLYNSHIRSHKILIFKTYLKDNKNTWYSLSAEVSKNCTISDLIKVSEDKNDEGYYILESNI